MHLDLFSLAFAIAIIKELLYNEEIWNAERAIQISGKDL